MHTHIWQVIVQHWMTVALNEYMRSMRRHTFGVHESTSALQGLYLQSLCLTVSGQVSPC